jgi:hypothetical protein
MSPQTCHQGFQGVQTLYQTEGKEKGKAVSLPERGYHKAPERNLACRQSPLFKASQGYPADLVARICSTFRRTLPEYNPGLTENLSCND